MVDVVKPATARCVIISACTGDESVPDESGGISCIPRMYLHRFVGIRILNNNSRVCGSALLEKGDDLWSSDGV